MTEVGESRRCGHAEAYAVAPSSACTIRATEVSDDGLHHLREVEWGVRPAEVEDRRAEVLHLRRAVAAERLDGEGEVAKRARMERHVVVRVGQIQRAHPIALAAHAPQGREWFEDARTFACVEVEEP